jgi:hypothetical protein
MYSTMSLPCVSFPSLLSPVRAETLTDIVNSVDVLPRFLGRIGAGFNHVERDTVGEVVAGSLLSCR